MFWKRSFLQTDFVIWALFRSLFATIIYMYVFVVTLRYRRSYDSEYTAPLVNHHIWPALMQGAKVLMKGEACTRRGASLVSEGRKLNSFYPYSLLVMYDNFP